MTNDFRYDQEDGAGLRARMLDTYSKIDLADLSPQQVMEFILFYIFPRGDVSNLADRLLEQYGTVQNVLDKRTSSKNVDRFCENF